MREKKKRCAFACAQTVSEYPYMRIYQALVGKTIGYEML